LAKNVEIIECMNLKGQKINFLGYSKNLENLEKSEIYRKYKRNLQGDSKVRGHFYNL
jgi:hypothetical protein